MNDSQNCSRVLLIDSDDSLVKPLAGTIKGHKQHIDYASSLDEGMSKCAGQHYDVVLLRDRLPDGLASKAVADLQARPDAPEIIIFTTMGQPEEAEQALKAGVWEYLVDPTPAEILPGLLKRAIRYRTNKLEDFTGRLDAIRLQLSEHGIIGSSRIMQTCIDLTVRIAQSEANVLIYGESGTGKELFASAIHNLSPRSDQGMTIVDCAALPPSLVESILFGHTKGSFTGADKAQQGLVAQSDRGTLFLDEIGEIPLGLQKKLLRVIQERTFLPIGASNVRKSNFRLIAASNRDLKEMVKEGTFREDLLFRLKTFYLELPALRKRNADITELAYYCRDKFCKQHKLKKKTFSPDYSMLLKQYEWPGNVRELFQALERSLIDAQESTTLYPKHLPPSIRIEVTKKKMRENRLPDASATDSIPLSDDPQDLPTLKEARDKAIESQERAYLERLLNITGSDMKRCCEIAGLSRSRLYDLLKKYDLVQNRQSPQKPA